MNGFGSVLGSQGCLSLATNMSISMHRQLGGAECEKGCKAHCTAIDWGELGSQGLDGEDESNLVYQSLGLSSIGVLGAQLRQLCAEAWVGGNMDVGGGHAWKCYGIESGK